MDNNRKNSDLRNTQNSYDNSRDSQYNDLRNIRNSQNIRNTQNNRDLRSGQDNKKF